MSAPIGAWNCNFRPFRNYDKTDQPTNQRTIHPTDQPTNPPTNAMDGHKESLGTNTSNKHQTIFPHILESPLKKNLEWVEHHLIVETPPVVYTLQSVVSRMEGDKVIMMTNSIFSSIVITLCYPFVTVLMNGEHYAD